MMFYHLDFGFPPFLAPASAAGLASAGFSVPVGFAPPFPLAVPDANLTSYVN